MDISIRDLGDALLYLGALAAAITAIGVVVRLAVWRPFTRFIARMINEPLVEIRDRLESYGDLSKRFDDHLVNHHGVKNG